MARLDLECPDARCSRSAAIESNGYERGGSRQQRKLERAKGIEPSYAAWEAAVLPLNYARLGPCSSTPFKPAKPAFGGGAPPHSACAGNAKPAAFFWFGEPEEKAPRSCS